MQDENAEDDEAAVEDALAAPAPAAAAKAKPRRKPSCKASWPGAASSQSGLNFYKCANPLALLTSNAQNDTCSLEKLQVGADLLGAWLRQVKLGEQLIAVGDVVMMAPDGEDDAEVGASEAAPLALVQALWETAKGTETNI